VDRHAQTATIHFTLADPPAALLGELRQLDGVREVERDGARVTVHGSRLIIAHVGAALVRWDTVPGDLSVHIPSLEDALLRLLGEQPPAARPAVAELDLTGGRR
jgi:hypothetical protein